MLYVVKLFGSKTGLRVSKIALQATEATKTITANSLYTIGVNVHYSLQSIAPAAASGYLTAAQEGLEGHPWAAVRLGD